MASRPDYPLLSARDFLEIDFGERRAELDNGVIRMMAGGTARHARVQTNILVALANRLRGTDCTPYNSDMAALTHDRSVRYPDVSVYCGRDGPADDDAKAFGNPQVLFEVLSAGTARTDLRVKLEEYRAMASVETIVFVDIATERLRFVQRTGRNSWNDVTHDAAEDVSLPSLQLVIPHAEIFARD